MKKRKEKGQRVFARETLGCQQKFWIFKTRAGKLHTTRARFTRRLLTPRRQTQNARTKKKVPALSGVLISRDDARVLVLVCLLFFFVFFFFSFLCLEPKTLSNWKRKEKNY